MLYSFYYPYEIALFDPICKSFLSQMVLIQRDRGSNFQHMCIYRKDLYCMVSRVRMELNNFTFCATRVANISLLDPYCYVYTSSVSCIILATECDMLCGKISLSETSIIDRGSTTIYTSTSDFDSRY